MEGSVLKQLSTQELRAEQLMILDTIDAFCREHNLRYFLHAGTLIGAVRHHGYIPWDDDIDLGMPRADFDRFLAEFPQTGPFRVVHAGNTPGYYLASAKVISERTVLIEQVVDPIPLGVFVDLFPLDAIPDSEAGLNRLNLSLIVPRNLLLLKNTLRSSSRSALKNAVLRASQLLLRPIPTQFLLRRIDRRSRSCNGKPHCSRLACICAFTYGKREVFPGTDYKEAAELPFEGKLYSAPIGYHSVLSRMYGDYMQLPPAEKQVTHHDFTAYWRKDQTK